MLVPLPDTCIMGPCAPQWGPPLGATGIKAARTSCACLHAYKLWSKSYGMGRNLDEAEHGGGVCFASQHVLLQVVVLIQAPRLDRLRARPRECSKSEMQRFSHTQLTLRKSTLSEPTR